MSERAMTLERFSQILDAYGAAPLRWPAKERHAAQTFSAMDTRAAALLREVEALDHILDQAPLHAASAALVERILAKAPAPSRVAIIWNELFPRAPLWAPALGAVTAIMMGAGLQAAALDHTAITDVAMSEEAVDVSGDLILGSYSDEEIKL